jgi:UDP-glucuronate decarboxylase
MALMAVDTNPMVPINLGNPGEFTVAELAELVSAAVGRRCRTTHLPLPQDDPRRRQPDISRARNVLGWQPEVSLPQGLADTIAHFRMIEQTPRQGAATIEVSPAL